MKRAEMFAAVRERRPLDGEDLTKVDPFLADLSGMSLTGADLSRPRPPYEAGGKSWPLAMSEVIVVIRRRARLRGADASGANLSRILGHRGDFRDARLRDARFVQADLTDADFRGADIRGADFSGSNLEGARFGGASVDDTTVWPDGFTPRLDRR